MKRNRFTSAALGRRTAALAVGVAVAAVTFTATAPAASARTWAGGVDVISACMHQYGWQYKASLDDDQNAYSWYCYNAFNTSITQKPVNVDAYCKWLYGGNAYADPQGGGAYDWGCYYR